MRRLSKNFTPSPPHLEVFDNFSQQPGKQHLHSPTISMAMPSAVPPDTNVAAPKPSTLSKLAQRYRGVNTMPSPSNTTAPTNYPRPPSKIWILPPHYPAIPRTPFRTPSSPPLNATTRTSPSSQTPRAPSSATSPSLNCGSSWTAER